MKFANDRHGYIAFLEMFKIMQHSGYADATLEDAIAIVIYSKNILLDYFRYLDDVSKRNVEMPSGAAFCPFVVGSRFEPRNINPEEG